MSYQVRLATSADHATIAFLLTHSGMVAPVFDAPSFWYVAIDDSDAIHGVIGAEFGIRDWLLRSALVCEPFRGHGVGRMLVAQILHAALVHRIDAVYCFSTDAQEYWAHMGFVEVPVSAVLERLPQVPQVLQFADFGWLPTEVAWRYDIQS